MKRLFIFFSIPSLLLFSCDSDGNNKILTQHAQIDSIAKVNAVKQDELNRKKNDSTINAMANAQADSMEKAEKSKQQKNAAKATK